MSQLISFTVLGIAAPQGSMRAFVGKKTGRAFMTSDNKRTMPWRQDVAACAERACAVAPKLWPITGACEMQVVFCLPRPMGHHGKKGLRKSAPPFPEKKPDLSKLIRAVEDALTGIVYDDDARIVRHDAKKTYADDGQVPHAYVRVTTLDSHA